LEAGRARWVQPWGTAAAKAPLAMPKNAATSRLYSINVLILWGSVIEHGFPVQGWVTFRKGFVPRPSHIRGIQANIYDGKSDGKNIPHFGFGDFPSNARHDESEYQRRSRSLFGLYRPQANVFAGR